MFCMTAVLAVALSLRAPITAVPPIVELIGSESWSWNGTGNTLGAFELGVLTAIPLIGFSIASLLAAPMARRPGPARSILFALVILIAAVLMRSIPAPGALWLGTMSIGIAIAVGNVLLPVIVKERWPRFVAAATGAYTASSALAAAIAAAAVIPVTREFQGDWRAALALWVVVLVPTTLLWWNALVRFEGDSGFRRRAEPTSAHPWGVLRAPLAWAIMLYMGLQAATYYALVAWIPSMERSIGVAPAVTGLHLAVFIGVGIVSGILASWAAQVLVDQRWLSATSSALLTVAVLGGLAFPDASLSWIVLAGASSGSVFPVAIAFIGLRSEDPTITAQLSVFVQGGGYLLAILGPALAGLLRDLTGGWAWTLGAIAILSLAQIAAGFVAGSRLTVDAQLHRGLSPRAPD